MSETETARHTEIAREGVAKPPFRTGDHVHHKPSGEKWIVAYADPVTGRLAPFGWPDSEAETTDCSLIDAASDAEHKKALDDLLLSGGRRASIARRLYGTPATGPHPAEHESESFEQDDSDDQPVEFMRVKDNHALVGPVVYCDDLVIAIQVATVEEVSRTPDAFEPVPPPPPLTEEECFMVEAARQHGFEILDDNATMYIASPAQIVALVRAARLQGQKDTRPRDDVRASGGDAERLRKALGEILNYRGGADSALDDEYVMERAHTALVADLAAPSPQAPAGEAAAGLPWRDMATAPHSVPIVAKHKPNESMPQGWVATIVRSDPAGEDTRFGYPDTILNYNGEALLGRFYGCWEGWLTVEEAILARRTDLAAPSPQAAADDYVLVPREPTEAMVIKGRYGGLKLGSDRLISPANIYRAMLAAAPQPTAARPGQVTAEAIEACADPVEKAVFAAILDAASLERENLGFGERAEFRTRIARETARTIHALTRDGDGDGEAWQPIETAPKDGGPIDLWYAGYRAADYRWDEELPFGPGWSDYADRHRPPGDRRYMVAGAPTHWRRPPAPPVPASADQGRA